MQWQDKDNNHPKVVTFTRWIDIGNYGNLESRSGVYIFADVNHQVKYIGKAGPGRMVAEIESAFSRGKDYGATKLKALYTNSDERALSLEAELIEKYNPTNNLT